MSKGRRFAVCENVTSIRIRAARRSAVCKVEDLMVWIEELRM